MTFFYKITPVYFDICHTFIVRLSMVLINNVSSCLQPSSTRVLVASWTSLLHFLLSLAIFNRSSNGIPVHSPMLPIHLILGSLFSCSRCSALHDFSLQAISFFSHYVSKVW